MDSNSPMLCRSFRIARNKRSTTLQGCSKRVVNPRVQDGFGSLLHEEEANLNRALLASLRVKSNKNLNSDCLVTESRDAPDETSGSDVLSFTNFNEPFRHKVQRKFTSDRQLCNKKILSGKKAKTEDFINFLCHRAPAKIRFPTHDDFMRAQARIRLKESIALSITSSELLDQSTQRESESVLDKYSNAADVVVPECTNLIVDTHNVTVPLYDNDVLTEIETSDSSSLSSGASEVAIVSSEVANVLSEKPSVTAEMPFGTSELPSVTSEMPSIIPEVAATPSEMPTVVLEIPSDISKLIAATSEMPAVEAVLTCRNSAEKEMLNTVTNDCRDGRTAVVCNDQSVEQNHRNNVTESFDGNGNTCISVEIEQTSSTLSSSNESELENVALDSYSKPLNVSVSPVFVSVISYAQSPVKTNTKSDGNQANDMQDIVETDTTMQDLPTAEVVNPAKMLETTNQSTSENTSRENTSNLNFHISNTTEVKSVNHSADSITSCGAGDCITSRQSDALAYDGGSSGVGMIPNYEDELSNDGSVGSTDTRLTDELIDAVFSRRPVVMLPCLDCELRQQSETIITNSFDVLKRESQMRKVDAEIDDNDAPISTEQNDNVLSSDKLNNEISVSHTFKDDSSMQTKTTPEKSPRKSDAMQVVAEQFFSSDSNESGAACLSPPIRLSNIFEVLNKDVSESELRMSVRRSSIDEQMNVSSRTRSLSLNSSASSDASSATMVSPNFSTIESPAENMSDTAMEASQEWKAKLRNGKAAKRTVEETTNSEEPGVSAEKRLRSDDVKQAEEKCARYSLRQKSADQKLTEHLSTEQKPGENNKTALLSPASTRYETRALDMKSPTNGSKDIKITSQDATENADTSNNVSQRDLISELDKSKLLLRVKYSSTKSPTNSTKSPNASNKLKNPVENEIMTNNVKRKLDQHCQDTVKTGICQKSQIKTRCSERLNHSSNDTSNNQLALTAPHNNLRQVVANEPVKRDNFQGLCGKTDKKEGSLEDKKFGACVQKSLLSSPSSGAKSAKMALPSAITAEKHCFTAATTAVTNTTASAATKVVAATITATGTTAATATTAVTTISESAATTAATATAAATTKVTSACILGADNFVTASTASAEATNTKKPVSLMGSSSNMLAEKLEHSRTRSGASDAMLNLMNSTCAQRVTENKSTTCTVESINRSLSYKLVASQSVVGIHSDIPACSSRSFVNAFTNFRSLFQKFGQPSADINVNTECNLEDVRNGEQGKGNVADPLSATGCELVSELYTVGTDTPQPENLRTPRKHTTETPRKHSTETPRKLNTETPRKHNTENTMKKVSIECLQTGSESLLIKSAASAQSPELNNESDEMNTSTEMALSFAEHNLSTEVQPTASDSFNSGSGQDASTSQTSPSHNSLSQPACVSDALVFVGSDLFHVTDPLVYLLSVGLLPTGNPSPAQESNPTGDRKSVIVAPLSPARSRIPLGRIVPPDTWQPPCNITAQIRVLCNESLSPSKCYIYQGQMHQMKTVPGHYLKNKTIIMDEFIREVNPKVENSRHDCATVSDIESKYWSLVESKSEEVSKTVYKVDPSSLRTVFPTNSESCYTRHPWNFNILQNSCLNVLKYDGHSCLESVPTLCIGELFASQCWMRNCHALPSLHYLHHLTEDSRNNDSLNCVIWYAVSVADSRRFEAAVKRMHGSSVADCSSMIHPDELLKFDIPVKRTVQRPGQFVFVGLGVYYAYVSMGAAVMESVSFATKEWIPAGLTAAQLLQEKHAADKFSVIKLVFSLTRRYNEITSNLIPGNDRQSIAASLLPSVDRIIKAELSSRRLATDRGLSHSTDRHDENTRCDHCNQICYLSAVVSNETDSVYCIACAVQLLKRRTMKSYQLVYNYSQKYLMETLCNFRALSTN